MPLLDSVAMALLLIMIELRTVPTLVVIDNGRLALTDRRSWIEILLTLACAIDSPVIVMLSTDAVVTIFVFLVTDDRTAVETLRRRAFGRVIVVLMNVKRMRGRYAAKVSGGGSSIVFGVGVGVGNDVVRTWSRVIVS